ncbi:DUF998 domain-containing protein [Sphaerisporangium corydalis]|uniref:DUF998 domain-containing protein n=1 Tax=Sphaerisporangium corydalis TaxID=1441875 RepID=A0ABV9ESG2_9ACTN|nr:DUF998 domain-containing protein [Sphaerisporangium corydalis]
METPTRKTPARTGRALLVCGVAGPALFVIAFLVEGATRAGYDPLRHPVSSLSIGALGWTQMTNFIVTGALILAFAAGLRLRGLGWASVLIALVGIGLVGAGLFTCDPISGYPPGTPMTASVRTAHGILHDLFSTPVFTALPAACFVVARRFQVLGQKGWALYCLVNGVAVLAAFVLTSMGFAQNPALMPIGGLLQRLTLVIGQSWIAILALHLLRRPLAYPQARPR